VGRAGIAELLRQGHRIGSHGAAHRDWTALPQKEVTREIHDPKRILAGMPRPRAVRWCRESSTPRPTMRCMC
jgi:peptidoglycan/xylan/chitin deacetylase (PgdA/CDA1 family)